MLRVSGRASYTFIQVILEANADFTFGVASNSQSSLLIDILLAEVDVLVRTRVYNFYVHALIDSGPDVCRDNNQLIFVRGIPYTFCGRVL